MQNNINNNSLNNNNLNNTNKLYVNNQINKINSINAESDEDDIEEDLNIDGYNLIKIQGGANYLNDIIHYFSHINHISGIIIN